MILSNLREQLEIEQKKVKSVQKDVSNILDVYSQKVEDKNFGISK